MYKKIIITVSSLLFLTNAFAQSGLNKSKKELIAFIQRPNYSALYPETSIDSNSIVTFSKDLKKGCYYSLNSYNRCILELLSQKIEDDNSDSILEYFKAYLKALNYIPKMNTDNAFENINERIIATIEKKGIWLNIIFKKF